MIQNALQLIDMKLCVLAYAIIEASYLLAAYLSVGYLTVVRSRLTTAFQIKLPNAKKQIN